MFQFDTKIPYEEYVKCIYHHARSYEIPTADTHKQRVAVKGLIAKAKQEESNKQYGNAYYYVNKCLLFFDKERNQTELVKSSPEARKIFGAALDLEAELKEKKLPEEYKARMEDIDRREPDRRRIVAQQLEADPPAGYLDGGTSTALSLHLEEQKRLLASENTTVIRLQQKLRDRTLNDRQVVPAPSFRITPPPAPPPAYTTVLPTPAPEPSPPAEHVPRPASPTRRESYARCLLNPPSAAVTKRRRGIVNLGNTCYMNSVLQVLNSTPLGQYFLTDDYLEHLVSREGKLTRLINSFSVLIRELNRQECNFSASASSLKDALGEYYEGFQNSKQQDANEFLRVVLDGVHGALNANERNQITFPEIDNSKGTDEDLARRYWAQYYQRNSSVVVKHCAFQERSSVTCPSCQHQSRSFNVSLGIEIPIPSSAAKVSLDDCFAAYCREEILDNSSLYMCPNCHQKVNARKQMLFFSAPELLFITLKRFHSYAVFSTASKVNSPVFFSKTLELSPFMCSSFSNTKYNLVGIVNHQGNMHGGHYTSDAVGPDGVWCNFSDERVTKADVADNTLAYILCYAR